MSGETDRELIVFGGTGRTGQVLVRIGLERGYNITLFVRDLARAEHLFNGLRSQLSFTEGDALNAADVHRAIGGNLHAVISAMGIYQGKAGGDDLTRATANLLDAMQAGGPGRLLCLSSIGVGDSRNQGDLLTRLIQKTMLRHILADKEGQEALINSSGLDWTLVRPSRLVSKGGPESYTCWTGPQPDERLTWSIHRAQVAETVLDSLENDATINQAINITGRK